MSTIKASKRSELASELLKSRFIRLNEWVEQTTVDLDEETATKIGKKAGKYVTLLSSVVAKGEREYYKRLENALSRALADMLGKPQTVLVVGLGNPSMTADALGKSVIERVRVTRGLNEDASCMVCTLCPNVLGVTGVESYDVVRGVVDRIKPDVILAVDSLCASSPSRLLTAFQLTDTGIAPGSGVNSFRFRIDKESMGVRVISIGVPLVVYASMLLDSNEEELVVTPKDVDILVEECAEVIAGAINDALF